MRIPTAATTDTLCLKIREIAARSPMDLAALDVLADMVIDRLDAEQRPPRRTQRPRHSQKEPA